MNHAVFSKKRLYAAHAVSPAVTLLLLVLVSVFCALPVHARTASVSFGELSVTAEADAKAGEIVVTAVPDDAFLRAKKGETIYLFALCPYETTEHLRTKSPAATASVSKSIEFRLTDEPGNRTAGYVAALGEGADYRVLHDPVYLSNPDGYAENQAQRTVSPSIKGLVTSQTLLSDAMNLGISHAVIPVALDRFLSDAPAGDPFSVIVGGTSTFFDPEKILQLDRHVKLLSDAGVQISLRFVLDGSARKTESAAACLYAEDAEDGAALYGLSLKTKKAYQTACGIFSYFAERYAADPARPTVDFILGYQVNEHGMWNNLGLLSDEEAARQYADAFVQADLALRSVSAHSRVYIPISNLLVSVRPFLTAFADAADGRMWGLGIAPYAAEPLSDTIWNDAVKHDQSSSYVTVRNLGVLKEFLSEEPFLYEGALRPVIIDDFAVQGTTGDDASQIRQAASLAYAYYQAEASGFIDALIYHRIHDGSNEGTSYGLRTLDDVKKPAYEVFRRMDTQTGTPLLKDYLSVIGAKNWQSAVDGFSKKDAEPIRLYEEAALAAPEDYLQRNKAAASLSFTGESLHGFLPGPYCAELDMKTPPGTDLPVGRAADASAGGPSLHSRVLTAELYPMPSYEAGGVYAKIPDPSVFAGTGGLSVTLRADAPAGISSVHVTVSLSREADGKKTLLSLPADIPAGQFTKIVFPTKDFLSRAGGADLIRVSVSPIGTPADAAVPAGMKLYIDEIVLYEGGSVLAVVMLWIVGILLLLVVIFALLVFRASVIRRKRRRLAARRAAIERQRRAAGGHIPPGTVPPPSVRYSSGRPPQTPSAPPAGKQPMRTPPPGHPQNRNYNQNHRRG